MTEALVLITPLVALAASLSVIYAIRCLDVVEREPKRVIVGALGLGALATIPATIAQIISGSLWRSITGSEEIAGILTTVVDAPISEEILKGIALLILLALNHKKLDSLTDYVIYACAVGIGFEVVENIIYQWGAMAGEQPVEGWVDEFNARIVASAGSHAFYSAWLGLGAWLLHQANIRQSWTWAFGSFSISVLLHAVNNFAAVLTELGPPDQLIPINRLGTSIGLVNDQVTLALFVGLIGVAVLRDLRFLSDFGLAIQAQLLQSSTQLNNEELVRLQELMNPSSHALASSGWTWQIVCATVKTRPQRSSYIRFARLALAYARGGQEVNSGAQALAGLIDEGVGLTLTRV